MLKEWKQAIILAKKGEFVAELNKGKTCLALYSLSIFFVEIEYENKTKKVIRKAIFQSGKELEKYLPANSHLLFAQ